MNTIINRIQKIPVIAASSTKRFIEESNKKRMTKEQLKKMQEHFKII